jgi:hypothetical protein
MDIDNLLGQQESVYLDFKREHHSETLSLLHDILCLANAWQEGDRFLVFGVADDKTIVGVEAGQNRRRGSEIQDLLRSSNLNRMPTVEMFTVQREGHEIDILVIRNRPDKPFFFKSDKTHQGRTIRAGVIYTRLGDTNVPLRESASEADMELAWRERFGFGLSPLRRAFRLLEEPEDWERVDDDNYQYHRDFPEFTVIDGSTLVENFQEEWTRRFPDRNASSFYVEIRYGTTVLRRVPFVTCDGCRYRLPLPSLIEGGVFAINKNSLAWRVMHLYRQYFPAVETLTRVGIQIIDGPSEDG